MPEDCTALQQGRHAALWTGSAFADFCGRPGCYCAITPSGHAARGGFQAHPSRWAASRSTSTTSAGTEAAASCNDHGKHLQGLIRTVYCHPCCRICFERATDAKVCSFLDVLTQKRLDRLVAGLNRRGPHILPRRRPLLRRRPGCTVHRIPFHPRQSLQLLRPLEARSLSAK